MKHYLSIARNVLEIPRRIREDENLSLISALDATGYGLVYDQIGVSELMSALYEDITFIDDWIQYSEDKRVPQGWYFKRIDGAAVVGFNAPHQRSAETMSFVNAQEACATFVKLEVESIRGEE